MSDSSLYDLDLAGIRWEISDTPIMSIRTQKPQSQQTPSTTIAELGRVTPTVVPAVAPAQTISVETVQAMAERPTDTATLNRMIGEFNHPLRATATNTILPHIGTGKLLILTDTPSTDDDATGDVLSDPAGEMIDKMLNAIGENRDTTSIVPIVFWRTPGGRAPSADELNLARPFVDRTIELIKPRVILTLGTLPAAQIANANLAKSHGVPVELRNGVTCVPIFHPNYLVLKPAAKRDVWNALQKVQNILKSAE
ncbi:MAG: uracil-DNA glycosylase [Alphaproteobacteria bacterium]|nr:uracil-DNA glycosylase [Alphaproteobacteria bacterium]